MRKKRKKKEKNKEKEGKIEKRRERNEKKRKIAEILFIFYALVFLGSFYALQIVLVVVQPGSVVHWRAVEGLTPATALRR